MIGNQTHTSYEKFISRRTALRLAGGTAVAGLAGCLSATDDEFEPEYDWPTLAYDTANTGHTQAQGPGDPDEYWNAETEPIISSPVVVDGVSYVASAVDGMVYAFDARTGDEQWKYSVDGSVQYTPTVNNGMIYVGTDEGAIHALEPDGSEKWRIDVDGHTVSSCTVKDDTLYASIYDNNIDLVALDINSGEELWREPFAAIDCTPAVVDGTVYSFGKEGSGDGTHIGVALDAATGEEQWRYEWKRDSLVPFHAPSVGDGGVYVGTGGKELLALDGMSGDERWVADLGGFVTQPPVVASDTLYTGITPLPDASLMQSDLVENEGSSVVALDVETGDEQWRRETEGFGAVVAMGSETLYRRTIGGIAAMDASDGEVLWTHDAEIDPAWEDADLPENIVQVTSQPAIIDEILFIASPSGGVYAIGEA